MKDNNNKFNKGDLISNRDFERSSSYVGPRDDVYGIIISVKQDKLGKIFGVKWSHNPDYSWSASEGILERDYKVVARGGIRVDNYR